MRRSWLHKIFFEEKWPWKSVGIYHSSLHWSRISWGKKTHLSWWTGSNSLGTRLSFYRTFEYLILIMFVICKHTIMVIGLYYSLWIQLTCVTFVWIYSYGLDTHLPINDKVKKIMHKEINGSKLHLTLHADYNNIMLLSSHLNV